MRHRAFGFAALGGIAAVGILCLGSTAGLAQQQPAAPKPADLQQHKTTPGGQYQPSLDVLGEKELQGYRTSKGTIQFAPEKPLPDALVKKIVRARVKENREWD